MKLIFFVIAILGLSFAEQYTDRYDDFNVEEMMHNKRLLASYLKCVLEQGRCTPEGKFIKTNIKDAIQTGCQKCTSTQKQKARTVIRYIRENEKSYWGDLTKKFDPENQYQKIYEAFLASSD